MFAIIAGLTVAVIAIYAVTGTKKVIDTNQETENLRNQWEEEKTAREAKLQAAQAAFEAKKPKFKHYDFDSELSPQQALAEEIAKRQPVVKVTPIVFAL
ncbi:hypothetical protein AB4455_06160 [Vibrio sp. 10N.261.46.E12]|mgnify:CR=1 FL=1|uniref:hypothetical protein n=1 Tax=unclassified Vibrio TaxID=2614977 RepID=UPI00097701B6|nr:MULTISPECIES: hypothetical protein [unclassified Vibrio]OMO34495.1 hypothetical protein BH584_12395 [Vibrio sp. 10N.261.45.E1]PMJ20135.1 hypothetical protein BCU27_20190 [Vibrio sp. 10N.286.45.B6]PML95753.1 hypothetical protein BCT66_22865 [Vibrio sp. 10N.261.49.E11]PMM70904.1 hypothetical protein BCT48_09100 [Vibrio sp. 10N.261.46.F12]PMM83212.1 hypothetical protein BCT46_12930 [Vibrio sp. 10N.261.46.E8]